MNQTVSAAGAVERAPAGSPVLAGLICNVQPMNADEMDEYSRRDIKANYKIYTPVDLDAAIIVGTSPNQTKGLNLGYILKDNVAGWTYTVTGVFRRYNPAFRTPLQYKILVIRRIL